MQCLLFKYRFVWFVLLIGIVSCSSQVSYFDRIIKDGKYDSEFPFYNASDELEKISKSIKLINSLAFYRRYHFPLASKIRFAELKKLDLQSTASYTETFNKSASGTAAIVSKGFNSVMLLTSAHIIDFADTIFSYYSDQAGRRLDYLESVSVKLNQSIYSNFYGGAELEVLVADTNVDVALIGVKFVNPITSDIYYYPFNPGNSNELTWGTFVYIFSFPIHNKMITKGIVSKPESSDPKFFLIDAVMNRGSSGGIVLAVRDGVPNFELVGIISWVPADRKTVLAPKQLVNDQEYQIDAVYEGSLYITDIENVKYGITKAVTIEKIKETILRNTDLIYNKGFAIPFSLTK